MTKLRYRIISIGICLLFAVSAARANASDTVIVMPFENRSQMPQYNWIRESFAILLADVLDVPGITLIGDDERTQAFQQVNLSRSDLLTRAAMIRVAESAKANLAVIGEYDIGGEKDHLTVSIRAWLIETQAGRLVGNKVFNFSGPLADLQQMQGQLAWHVLYERNPSLPYTKDQFVRRATGVPPRAYESFIKGVQTQDQQLREAFLRRAIQEHDSAGAPGRYGRAAFELGLLLYRRADFDDAEKQFKELTKDDPDYEESLFYLSLSAFKSGNFESAAASAETLAGLVPLPEILNNAGASLVGKGDNARALSYLQRAAANAPNDAAYRFNYGYALWRNQNLEEAARELRAATKINPRDGESWYVLSKALTAAGKADEAAQADNEAKRYLSVYAKWAVAPDKVPVLVRLREELNGVSLARYLRRTQQQPARPSPQQISQQQSLERAKQLVLGGNDAEALAELQRILTADTANAEAYYLRGVVYTRRNELESAVRALQAAVSWNPKLIEAHITLGRIYLARGDRAKAMAHCSQALGIDPLNRDAVGLKQQIEIGK
ncbi:MAG TPA: tetratricopeptide repeat protein [Blastocatellia bacterium]|nr:tetratricopeptide repeat protein [Blastocatellia bacterium]HMZ17170.1 tetratricopeptide repeat protein [Blastocatellia bacterium]HNG34864.1 tetratricopeptide repeat protein [Blastocatellia bacterium]